MAVQVSGSSHALDHSADALSRAEHEALRARELVACHTRLHELIAGDAPLIEVLTELVVGIERYEPSIIPCVVLLDPESNTLHPGAGPSLPPEWLAAIDGVVIGPNIGSCGAAAWSGEMVISEDMADDPRWEPIRDFAIRCGLRHCWSMPIVGAGGVLGTFALYGPHPRRPQSEQLELMQDGARLAGIAIQRRLTMEKLIHDARHDSLTGLPNRRAIFEQLDAALLRAQSSPTAVLFVDLDGLKVINDSLGHDRADELIREIAARLRTVVRGQDFVGRFGGDEFVIVAEGMAGRPRAAELAKRVLDAVSRPLPGGESPVVTASVGVTLVTDTFEARQAIREADSAMYAAKRAGRDGCHFYDGSGFTRPSRRLVLARTLLGAEMRGEMWLVFQPVFDLKREAVVGVEALLRWRHPDLGDVPPAEFIPVAEDSGAIIPLGGWVLRESCETIGALSEQLGRPLELSVNVSARQLARPGFANSVRQTMAHARFPAELLTLEITETTLISSDGVTERTLEDLGSLGVGIVLDDFGTGYSSLSLLTHHPVRGIKIDRGFLAGFPDDRANHAIVSGVIGIAHGIGCTVTAEGIENATQRNALRSLDCERGQGFLLARPVVAESLSALFV
jgi:diguanylate cyclase (GGDEF)-like protein